MVTASNTPSPKGSLVASPATFGTVRAGPGREHSDREIGCHTPRPGFPQLHRGHRGARGQVEHLVARADPQGRPGGSPPVPVLTQRQHGIGQVISAGDAVEHRRDVAGVFVQVRATHVADATLAGRRRGAGSMFRRAGQRLGRWADWIAERQPLHANHFVATTRTNRRHVLLMSSCSSGFACESWAFGVNPGLWA